MSIEGDFLSSIEILGSSGEASNHSQIYPQPFNGMGRSSESVFVHSN